MRAPVLAMGDGALGFWAAMKDVFPETKAQRCWFHKSANVLAAMPKSAHPAAVRAIQDIYNAEDGDLARTAAKQFAEAYGAKFPKAVAKIVDDLDVLLEFYNYPAEHWAHLRTTNPIESTFATVRHRTKVTKGPGSRAAGLAMAFKACRSRTGQVVAGERTATGRLGPGRCHLPSRQTCRKTSRQRRSAGRLKDLHPQVLTISPFSRTQGHSHPARPGTGAATRHGGDPRRLVRICGTDLQEYLEAHIQITAPRD